MNRLLSLILAAGCVATLNGLAAAQVPEPPPPTPVPMPVEPSTGTVTGQPSRVCVLWNYKTVRYVCGTEEKCTNVVRKKPNGETYTEKVCVDVETYCTKEVQTSCAQYDSQ